MPESATHEPPMSRAASALAHSLPVIVVVALVVRVAYFLQVPHISFVDGPATFLVLLGVIALAFHMRFSGLCLRCIRSSPLNPQLSVDRNKVFLWQFHWSRKHFWMVWASCWAALLASGFFVGIVKTLLKIPMDVLFFSMMWGFWAHHRLRPWCPYCRGWDEGGEEELIPDPDPAEKAKR